MEVRKLDHVNVRTANLDTMVEWYTDVLGMRSGARPPFSFPGAWMYADGHPAVHLVGVDVQPAGTEPTLEHFAMTATGLTEFVTHLEAKGIDYRASRVPGFGILQINIHDPDGNHIHIDFTPEEADAAGM
ncbi:MAG: VOC family protein [Pseudomonadota bacterium]